MDEVLFSTNDNGVATITLNRPKAINSLTYNMIVQIKEKLLLLEHDPAIHLLVLNGAGTKGFCAGGDIKTLYSARDSDEAMGNAMQFFSEEYETDRLIAQFPKPIIACLDGIVMGGGVGLSVGATHRIVTERTKWAMPEMNIGFFPDVGATYYLNQAPGHTGRYLALTASTLSAVDTLYANVADSIISSEQLVAFIDHVNTNNWHHENNVEATLEQIIASYQNTTNVEGKLASLQAKIDEHFAYDTVEEIIDSLQPDTSEFAVKTKEILLSKSPVSLKVALKQIVDGGTKTLEACLETDLIIAKNYMKSADFYEGVRSVIIDKDQQPDYQYKQLADVSEAFVDSFFTK
ncbi:enoyl-CoA hydratase/isomerase family protein [Oceanobacillus rekensis]|uniref:enoyl-CoA hydratase/isomerase family protein n=1 Tax=Oceanobacillus rekensis TaxID=937927 RepID=UPI000B4492DC|nr:enoyl-CoA hydratase/isomerase family protein [Oceanobacillus rekensis]